MKFGLLRQEDLNQQDWTLPPDHPANQGILDKQDEKKPFSYSTGCAKWNMDSWTGVHYPEGTSKKDQLKAYTQIFSSIELNSTFYRLSRSSIKSWMEEVNGTDFTFCPKWSRRVSHLKRLNDVDENIQYFVDSCALFENRLATTFLQMPDNFTPKYIDRIAHFLEMLPAGFPVHVEVRHEGWFMAPAFDELCSLLESYGKGLVITDVAGRRDVLHQRLTMPRAFIRFNGYGPGEQDHYRLDLWVERLSRWKQQGVDHVFFFFHHLSEVEGPENAKYFAEKMKEIS